MGRQRLSLTEIAAREASTLPVTNGRAVRAVDGDYLLGILVVALLPAVFWVGLFKLTAILFGFSFGWPVALLVGGSISIFLAGIYALMIRRR